MSKYLAGVRAPDGTSPYNLASGEYCKTDDKWWVCCPGEGYGGGVLDSRWTIEEHENGVISVTPSIHLTAGHDGEIEIYHGYLTNGVWASC